ncbi:MAG: SH3 domain-containing protein [Oricola sp.]
MKSKTILVALAALAAFATVPAPAGASAFHAWQVTDVSWGDVLNVRRWPSARSQIQAAYPNGTVLSLTGRCKRGVILDDIAGLPKDAQRAAVRYTWCEVWHDPAKDGEFAPGWVYMKYMRPY